MVKTYEDIAGWFDWPDLLDREVALAQDGATFVEVGVYKGRSLVYLADAIKRSGKEVHLYGVDRFTGDEECGPVTIDEVGENLKACVVDATLIQGDSADSATRFADGSCDFVFIDAAHDYKSVRRDIAAWLPKVKPGGVIAGHDRGMPGVHRAVTESFGGRVQTIGPLAWWVRV